MSLPSAGTLGKAVLMTAVSLMVINLVKPSLPESIRKLLG